MATAQPSTRMIQLPLAWSLIPKNWNNLVKSSCSWHVTRFAIDIVAPVATYLPPHSATFNVTTTGVTKLWRRLPKVSGEVQVPGFRFRSPWFWGSVSEIFFKRVTCIMFNLDGSEGLESIKINNMSPYKNFISSVHHGAIELLTEFREACRPHVDTRTLCKGQRRSPFKRPLDRF